jgi:hypothetical protein
VGRERLISSYYVAISGKQEIPEWAGGWLKPQEHLPREHETLNSTPNAAKKKKKFCSSVA